MIRMSPNSTLSYCIAWLPAMVIQLYRLCVCVLGNSVSLALCMHSVFHHPRSLITVYNIPDNRRPIYATVGPAHMLIRVLSLSLSPVIHDDKTQRQSSPGHSVTDCV